MGWGLDTRWSAIAAEHGWPIGVIDATPIRHLKPVAAAYPRDAAIAEAEAFLDGRAYVTRDAGRRGAGRVPMKPVLFVTNHAPAFRIGAFQALSERIDVIFALIGGDVRHGGGGTQRTPFPVVHPSQRHVARMAASGRYRAVVAGISGKIALPAAYAGARVSRTPFVLWATIWRHPRTPAHALSYLPLRHIYRHADAIATYGPHVSAYVRTKHPKGPVFEAPQAVDAAFWSADATPDRRSDFQVLFAGRPAPEKGFEVLKAGRRPRHAGRRARPHTRATPQPLRR